MQYNQSRGVTVCRSSAANGRGQAVQESGHNAQAVIWKMLLVAENSRRLKAPELMKDVYQELPNHVNGVPVNHSSGGESRLSFFYTPIDKSSDPVDTITTPSRPIFFSGLSLL